FDGERGGRFGERGENTTRVKPAYASLAKNVLPIDVPRLELADRGVTTIVISHSPAHAKPALGEVQAVARSAADAIVLSPLDEIGGDAALQDEVLDETAHLVVYQGRADRGAQTEAFAEAAGGV